MQKNDRIELFKCLTNFSEDPRATNYHKIIELIANNIINHPENSDLITDEFLTTIQEYGTAYKVFECLLNVPIVPNRKMLEELAELAKGILSSDAKRVIEWIKEHPVPLTLEEKLSIAEQQKAEMEASYENEISELRRQLLEKTSKLEKYATQITAIMAENDSQKKLVEESKKSLDIVRSDRDYWATKWETDNEKLKKTTEELSVANKDLDDLRASNSRLLDTVLKVKGIANAFSL
jgi:hypothetical protein